MFRTKIALAVGLLVGSLTAGAAARQPPPHAGPGPHGLVRAAAASDLRFALDAMIARLHERNPGVDVRVTYGSSGTFFAQLTNGAPFDIFLSADVDYTKQLVAKGLTLPDSQFAYAIGRLVLWTRAASGIDVDGRGFAALSDARVQHVAIANPATAPYGRAAEAALKTAGVFDGVKGKLVLGETVAQTLQFAQTGAADVGIVALSLAIAPNVKNTGRFWTIPVASYPSIDQGGVIMKNPADLEAALTLRNFMLSDAGRTILKQYGFALPATPQSSVK
jgi:molybdate transport system substrate-binding protein